MHDKIVLHVDSFALKVPCSKLNQGTAKKHQRG